MNRKWLPYFVILALAIILFFVRRWQQVESWGGNTKVTSPAASGQDKGNQAGNSKAKDPGAVNRNRGFDRRTAFLEYTRHAKCRMGCRQITEQEVAMIMADGKINYKKSDVDARPCPEYALEGNTDDGQRVRIVFAQCDSKTKVITVIDLGKEWSCDCPGDKKHNP